MSHRNARLTTHGRRLLVERVRFQGMPVAHVAKAMGISKFSAVNSIVATICRSVMSSIHPHHQVNRHSFSFGGVHWPLNPLSNNGVHTYVRDVVNDVFGSEEQIGVLGSAVAV